MTTTTPDYLSTLRTGLADAAQQWLDQMATAWDQWVQAWTPVADAGAQAFRMPPSGKPGGRHHDHHGGGQHRDHHNKGGHDKGGCGCGGGSFVGVDLLARGATSDCGCGYGCGSAPAGGCCEDPCACCVPEADVVIRTRAGERRVVPFRVRNPWRREREVTLEVGPWQVCSGEGVQVRAELEQHKIVLGPCEDAIVRLVVATTSPKADPAVPVEGQDAKGQDLMGQESEPVKTADGETRGRLSDIASCVSAYADVRFEGCARPVRVAVVVLPAECDPVDVGCDCGCCC